MRTVTFAPSRTTPHVVRVEFVVDTARRVDLATLRAASPEGDAPYLAAIREALAMWEYAPATTDGVRVARRMRQAFTVR